MPSGVIEPPGQRKANDYITGLSLTYDGAVYGTPSFSLWFDDVGFITAVVPTVPPPSAGDDTYSVAKDQTLTVAVPGVLANDTDTTGGTLTAHLVTPATHGTVTLNGDGSLAYTPAPGSSGTDGFTSQASDGTLSSAPATVTITVRPVVGSIRGVLWNDANGNGAVDGTESTLAGRTVYLDQDRDGVLDGGELSTTTAADGSYAFAGLPVGTYDVAEVLPRGWSQTAPGTPRLPGGHARRHDVDPDQLQ